MEVAESRTLYVDEVSVLRSVRRSGIPTKAQRDAFAPSVIGHSLGDGD